MHLMALDYPQARSEQRYLRLLDTVDQYLEEPSTDHPTGANVFFSDLTRALDDLAEFPTKQLERIQELRNRLK